MRFLLDENLPRSAARILRDAGHEVVAVVESPMRGEKDPELLRVCNEENRVFITLDVGIRLTGGTLRTGAVLLRPPREFDAADVEELLLGMIAHSHLDRLLGRITVLSPGRVRTRPLA
jgi:hypothetical protein